MSDRPGRLQLPTLVAGVVIGALMVGGVAPLVGSDRESNVSTSASDVFGDAPQDAPVSDLGDPTTDAGVSSGDAGDASGPAGIAGSSDDGSSNAGPGGGPSDPATSAAEQGPRTASDVGVTPDSIRVGSMTLNCEVCPLVGAGGLDPTPHGVIAKAFVDDINARGGIHGRKLELHTADYDPAEDAVNGGGTERQACLELTENKKVFAVLVGGTFANACVYDEHKTPLLTNNDTTALDPDTFNRTGGRLWLVNPSMGRTLLDWARQLDRQRLLTESTKFGIVLLDGPQRTQVERYLLPELRRLGYTPSHVSVLPNDYATVAAKVALEVPAMQGKGVTHVLMATDYHPAQTWLREAQENEWKPQYLQSDFPGGAHDFQGDNNSQASDNQWRGAIAVSSIPEVDQRFVRDNAQLRRCLDIYEKNSGNKTSQVLRGWVFTYCNQYGLFERAAKRAGVNLTRRSFAQAMASLGQVPLAELHNDVGSFGGRYGLGGVKWSAKDFAQRKVYQKPCPRPQADEHGCYVPVGPVYPMAA